MYSNSNSTDVHILHWNVHLHSLLNDNYLHTTLLEVSRVVCDLMIANDRFLYRRLRQKETSIYHIQLSLSMLFMLIVSFVLILFSAEHLPPPLYEGCMMVSVLVHYFTLVAVMWMGAEALLMFQKLVIIFFQLTKRFIAILSIICWGKSLSLLALCYSSVKKVTFKTRFLSQFYQYLWQ